MLVAEEGIGNSSSISRHEVGVLLLDRHVDAAYAAGLAPLHAPEGRERAEGISDKREEEKHESTPSMGGECRAHLATAVRGWAIIIMEVNTTSHTITMRKESKTEWSDTAILVSLSSVTFWETGSFALRPCSVILSLQLLKDTTCVPPPPQTQRLSSSPSLLQSVTTPVPENLSPPASSSPPLLPPTHSLHPSSPMVHLATRTRIGLCGAIAGMRHNV